MHLQAFTTGNTRAFCTVTETSCTALSNRQSEELHCLATGKNSTRLFMLLNPCRAIWITYSCQSMNCLHCLNTQRMCGIDPFRFGGAKFATPCESFHLSRECACSLMNLAFAQDVLEWLSVKSISRSFFTNERNRCAELHRNTSTQIGGRNLCVSVVRNNAKRRARRRITSPALWLVVQVGQIPSVARSSSQTYPVSQAEVMRSRKLSQ